MVVTLNSSLVLDVNLICKSVNLKIENHLLKCLSPSVPRDPLLGTGREDNKSVIKSPGLTTDSHLEQSL